ncbi:LysR substrate-binding domain-containing protein [Actinoplanes sp. Pm04-4]|uniref:LysR substrate-binding domain-containing protein n=1 Tax=Paractinoplanes pyxinae TaxID=2997416 RepID=A0ABT4AQQ1_9ACTN|nr:LysR family transcriptional regulator [Actinoplanes pyxinae]MCY1136568.1 LysR substrate-binding domain-containing protein [Actinoplanes pyxinae]
MAEISLSGLRAVRQVATLGSFTAAAEALGYTQSAVSRQVAAMEQVAGAPLFERHARGVRPTAVGEVLLRHAGALLDAAEAAERDLATARERLAGRLIVGAYPTGHLVLVPRALALMRDEHPGVEVTLRSHGSRSLLRMLRAQQVEVAIIVCAPGDDPDLTGLRHERLLGARLRVAVADGHRLAGRGSVTPDDLRDEPWIVGAAGPGDGHLGAWPGIERPRIAYAVKDWHARLGMVAAGLGVALVPGSVMSLMSRGITALPVDDDGPHTRHVLAVTHPAADPLAAAFLAVLRRVADPAIL